MVDYSDITKHASEAFTKGLLESEQSALEAAKRAAEKLGLGECMAEEVAEHVSSFYQQRATRSAESF